MNKTAQYLIFYSVFCLFTLGIHLYAWLRLRRLLVLEAASWQLLVVVVLALLFPACTVIEKYWAGPLSRVLYTATSIWLGFVLLLVTLLVLYEPLRLLPGCARPGAGWALLAVSIVLTAMGLVNATSIAVRRVVVPLQGLTRDMRMVQLSDIHVGTIHGSAYLERIVAMTNQQAPEVVCITGDMFDGIGPVNRATLAPLRQLSAPVLFVMGNHEKYGGCDRIAALLKELGVDVVRNAVRRIGPVQIAGVDYPEREGQRENPVVRQLSIVPDLPCVLLYHLPAGMEDAREAGVDLQLSGHTHDGQFFPFNYLTRLFFPFSQGLFRVGTMHLYVSAGTGTWGPPLRLGSRSEITCVELVPGSP